MGFELRSRSRGNPNQVGLILTMTESLSSIRLQEEFPSNSSSYGESAPSTPHLRPVATETLRGRMVVYDNRDLPETLWERASKGISSGNFAIDRCAVIQQRGYYAFRIVESQTEKNDQQSDSGYTVRIGHAKDEYGLPVCSCQEFSETNSACSHIFWLMDRIIDYSGEIDIPVSDNNVPQGSVSLPLQPTGSALMTTTAYDQIDRMGLAALATSKGWDYFEPIGTGAGEFELAEEHETALGSKEEDILDMLAFYSGNDSPYFDKDGILGSSNSLASAVYRMSMGNPHVFKALRAETPEDMCALSYIRKMREQVKRTFGRWRTFIERGIPTGPEAQPDEEGTMEDGAPTASWCAAALKTHVRRIDDAVEKRRGIDMGGMSEIMELLVHILSEVVQYHSDPPQRLDMRDSIAEPSSPIPTIYELLVKDALPNEPPFIIHSMRKLVPVGVRFTQELQALLFRVKDAGANAGYIQDISDLIDEIEAYQERPVTPSSPALKRKGDALQSPIKRRFNTAV